MPSLMMMVVILCLLLTPTFAQTDDDVITPENVDQLTLVKQFGSGFITDIVYSNDANWLAVGGTNGLWIYDVQHPENIPRQISDLYLLGFQVVFTRDDRYLIGVALDGFIAVWDVTTGEQIKILQGHTERVSYITMSPDGSQFITTSTDMTARIWSTETWQTLFVLEHPYYVWRPVYHPSGDSVLTFSNEIIHVWSSQTGELIQTIPAPLITALSFHPSGEQMVTVGLGGVATLWDVATYTPIEELIHDEGDMLRQVRYSPDGTKLAIVLDRARMLIYDMQTREDELFVVGLASADDAIFSPDGQYILISNPFDGAIQVRDSATGDFVKFWEHTANIYTFAQSPDGQSLLVYTGNGYWRTYDMGTWELTSEWLDDDLMEKYLYPIRVMAYSYDGSRIITIRQASAEVEIRDAQTLQVQHVLDDRYVNIFIHPNQLQFLTLDFPESPLWDMTTGTAIDTIEALSNSRLLRYHPSGRFIAFAPGGDIINNQIFIWDTENQKVTQTLDGHSGFIESMTYSPSGDSLATGSSNAVIRIWDVATGEITHTLRGHRGLVKDIVFSPDGQLLVSASEDDTVLIWNLETGDLVYTIPVIGPNVFKPYVQFSHDGRYLLIHDDFGFYIWGIPQG